MMPNPWVIVAFIVALGVSFTAGWTVHGWQQKAAVVSTVEKAVEKQAVNYGDGVKVEADLGANRDAGKTKTETIIKTVIKYVHEDSDYCGLRADTVRVLDAGRTGQPMPAAVKPDGSDAPAVAP